MKRYRAVPRSDAPSDAHGGERPRRLAWVVGGGVLAVALATLLTGCGIRDTSVPVDAGEAASRTACPPSPNATLSVLERYESWLPFPSGTRTSVPVPGPSAAASLREEAHGRSPVPTTAPVSRSQVSASASPAGSGSGSGSGSDSASGTPTPTASDGTLACLHDPSGTPSTTATPAPTP